MKDDREFNIDNFRKFQEDTEELLKITDLAEETLSSEWEWITQKILRILEDELNISVYKVFKDKNFSKFTVTVAERKIPNFQTDIFYRFGIQVDIIIDFNNNLGFVFHLR